MRLRSITSLFLLTFALAVSAFAQTEQPKTAESAAGPTPKVTPTPKPTSTPKPAARSNGPVKVTTAEEVAESAIFLYGYPGGRATLNQIRKSTQERGTANITNAEGKAEKVKYMRDIIRGETLAKERVRIDQEFPNANYALVRSGDKVYGIYNNTVFTPRDDAAKTFENQIFRSIEALLRYKEDESKIELASKEKVAGVEYYIVDLTDKQDRKTRYFVSAKSFRVMMLTYEDGGVKFKRRFYDYNYAQGTLVPYRTVLWADDRVLEETEVGTITFGQKVDEELFKSN